MGHAVENLNLPDAVAAATLPDEKAFQILILEDSDFDRQQIERICKRAGVALKTHFCTCIADFETALDITRYDLVMIDYLLPESNGLAAQEMLQDHPINFATPVVLMSSNVDPELAINAIKRGSLDCVEKGVLDVARLRELIFSSARMFAEFSRQSMNIALEKQRQAILHDMTEILRQEIDRIKFSDMVEQAVGKSLVGMQAEGQDISAVVSLFDKDDAALKFK